MKYSITLALLLTSITAIQAYGAEPGWKHSGSVFLITTAEGANLPASAVVRDFPVLVTLRGDFFDFQQAKPRGEDLRFFGDDGKPLAYEIDECNPERGMASVWVRVPVIRGQSRQEIKVRWGNPSALSESNAKAVFNKSNGYLSVWHMNDPLNDELGTLETTNTGTFPTKGMIGLARRFPGYRGLFGGDKIMNYPSGAESHSTEAWFRAEVSNTTIIGWGNEGGGRGSKVRMQFRSPPHLHIDSDFADVNGEGRLALGEWTHVVHTYNREEGKIYINGKLDGSNNPLLDIKRPSRLWIGGWYDNYDFVGDIDEVRISTVARSADWIALQYENLKRLQTLVGPLVRPGDAFTVSEKALNLDEGTSRTITAEAGGAQKLYWSLKQDGRERLVATDRLAFAFAAGRVEGDRSLTLQLKAVYPREIKIREIPITIKETIPEPEFTIAAPASWNGRDKVEVVPTILNEAAMQAKGANALSYQWSVDGMAVIKEVGQGKLVLKRALNSGDLTVRLAIGNGGRETVHSAVIRVKEPTNEPWVVRLPGKNERPSPNQFYARDDHHEGTLVYNGTLEQPAEAVFLKLHADGKLIETLTQKPGDDQSYAFSVKLKPGLIRYKVEFGSLDGTTEKTLDTVDNLVCGDAYLIDGQSNAEATDVGEVDPPYNSPWIRSYGSMTSDPEGARWKGWANAVVRDREGGKAQVGYWGLELARRLMEAHKMPICIINGAVGGSRIDRHQRDEARRTHVLTIYGRLLWRVQEAKLTHGIRGVIWHQGENDQGADGPTGAYGWETYKDYFNSMAACWKEDYPNIQHFYLFQIWPKACSMGEKGSDNRLREVQRRLPEQFSNLGIMSTLGIKPPGGCHYPVGGYDEFARLIAPLLERDHYGVTFKKSITPPNLLRAAYASAANDEILLEFDQPVVWNDAIVSEFSFDHVTGKVASGSALGNMLKLKLTGESNARSISYINGDSWSPDRLLIGENGIAALSFCEVPISAKP